MLELRDTELLVHAIELKLGRVLVPQVRTAFLQVPRSLFVERYYQQRGNSLTWDLIAARAEQVYDDEALVTLLDERGHPASSSSQPSVMAVQLEALDLQPGFHVLEIGAGTGYNAALMGKMVGETGQIVTLDINTNLVSQARLHLACAHAFNVLSLTSDGFAGYSDHAPYDRMLSTCAIRSIPHTWMDQLKPGGVLVCNWLINLASLFLHMEKRGSELTGSFLDLSATYMEMRSGALPPKEKVDWKRYEALPGKRISLPGLKTLLMNPAFCLLLQCFLPTMKKRYHSIDNQTVTYLLSGDTAVQVDEDALMVLSHDDVVERQIKHSIDLYDQLDQPCISDYRVTFQKQQAVISIRDLCFLLPIS